MHPLSLDQENCSKYKWATSYDVKHCIFWMSKSVPIEKGVLYFHKKCGAYIEKLPQGTQDQIFNIFESTTWYLAQQVT